MDWEEKSSLIHADNANYRWTQTINNVNVEISVPEGTSARDVEWYCKSDFLKVGLKGQPPILNGKLSGVIRPSESTWTLEDKKMIYIQLQKAKTHDSWPSILDGKDLLDIFTKEKMDKSMMLEKFQSEYPNFDFSGAEFSGNIPNDPANYLHPSILESNLK